MKQLTSMLHLCSDSQVNMCVYLNFVCPPPVCGSSPAVLFSWHQTRVSSHSREMSISLHIHTPSDSIWFMQCQQTYNCFDEDMQVFIYSSCFLRDTDYDKCGICACVLKCIIKLNSMAHEYVHYQVPWYHTSTFLSHRY